MFVPLDAILLENKSYFIFIALKIPDRYVACIKMYALKNKN